METRSKRRRLISLSSYDSLRPAPAPDVPATFESLNDDTLTTVLEFVGGKSYAIYAGINKRCKEVYLHTPGMTKETFLYGYAPLALIIDKFFEAVQFYNPSEELELMGKGVVLYNRRDLMEWAIQEQQTSIIESFFEAAASEGRLDILDEVWNISQECSWFRWLCFHGYRTCNGKLNVLKWFLMKGIFDINNFNNERCENVAAYEGHLHILQWLKEDIGLQLKADLYDHAIWGNQLNVLKWLREQEVSWGVHTFRIAAKYGNLDILQWLHDEGCPWDCKFYTRESWLEPEAQEWLIANGYGDRIRS
eukprot:CAMPEP_0178952780 /NCGR_PEP_ID=MMETSP0789-20121207/8043_1 /TAXON_ID=3005 /ORGANISM="Rhizosolenia setigera, Strain CCMP 1694" /LENGTH=305 /DNA_ID=CAMNT_0020633945 /DNA_START=64 /DNA_END=981 /DNA_ORIENTATION=-